MLSASAVHAGDLHPHRRRSAPPWTTSVLAFSRCPPSRRPAMVPRDVENAQGASVRSCSSPVAVPPAARSSPPASQHVAVKAAASPAHADRSTASANLQFLALSAFRRLPSNRRQGPLRDRRRLQQPATLLAPPRRAGPNGTSALPPIPASQPSASGLTIYCAMWRSPR